MTKSTASRGIVVATSIPPKLARRDAANAIDHEYQDLCVRSWLECGFRILSVNDPEEIPALAQRYPDVEFVPTDRNASALTGRKNPYISDLLRALAATDAETVGIINSDLVFEPSRAWREWLPAMIGKVAVTGQRYDTTSLLHGGLRTYYWGFDHFFFDRAVAAELVDDAFPYAMGVPWWDYWMPLALAAKGRRVLTIDRPAIIHLAHETAWREETAQPFAFQFAKFTVSAFGQSDGLDPELAAVVESCRKLLEVPELALSQKEGMPRIAHLAEIVATNYVALLRKNVVRLAQSSDGVAESGAGREKYSPAAVFARFDTRVDATRTMDFAEQLQKQGRRGEAEAAYRDALAKLPDDADIAFHCANYFFESQNLGAALALFKRATELQPQSGKYLVGLGTALGALGRRAEAVTALERAIEIDPTNPIAYFNLTMALNDLGRRAEGLARFEAALNANPDFAGGAEWYFHLRQKFRATSGAAMPPEYFGQRAEDAILDEFFGFRRNGFFVDVGAFDGIYLSNSYAFERKGWDGLCIEAAPKYFDICKKNRPRSRCVNVACVAAERGMVSFQFERGGLFSGLQSDMAAVADTFARTGAHFEGFESIEVPSATLNHLLEKHQGPIDFVSIDVEGNEIDVLKGFDLERFRPRVLVMEANTPDERQALDGYLADHGYRLARSNGWNHFYAANDADVRALKAIVVSAKLARPSHPLGENYDLLGYGANPFIYRPAVKEMP